MTFGFLYTNILEQKYDTIYEAKGEIEEHCIVIAEKEPKEYKDLYKVKIVNSKNSARNGTKLYIRVNKKANIEVGDMLLINGTYLEPDVARNERGFNYKEYLKTLEIYGTVEINHYKVIKKGRINKLILYTARLKEILKSNISKVIKKAENKNLLIAMILGDTEDLSEELKTDFLNSNLYHILSVSGGQVSNIIIGITILFRLLKIHKKIMDVLCIVILIEFMFLTGLTPSIIRACIMCIISLISGLIIRRYDIANSLGISLLIILINNPFAINSLSVLLSYFGFLGIIVLGSFTIKEVNKVIKNNILRYILNIVISSVAAQIFIFPIILYIFGTISLTFIFSNLLIIPLSTVITIIGLFIMICPLQIFGFVEPLIELTINIVGFFSNIGISKIYCIIPNIKEIITYYVMSLYLYYMLRRDYIYKIKHFFRKYKKIIVIILLLSIGTSYIYKNIQKDLYINFIDVGQGDSTLITTQFNKKILIDGGGSEFGSTFDVGEKTLLPYLLKKKIHKLDYVIISHFDSDHVGGILTILEELNVKQVLIPKQVEYSENYNKFLNIIKKRNIKVKIVGEGNTINIDKDTYLDILWPEEKQITDNVLNNNSLIVRLCYKNFKMLFTGDIEEIAEQKLLQKYEKTEKLTADILKVAHHGSKSSSIAEFLEKVNPRIALIGVGKNNKFGHPNAGVLDRLNMLRNKNI
jgi:DNA internalization competence protein ComEC/Rec2-like protein